MVDEMGWAFAYLHEQVDIDTLWNAHGFMDKTDQFSRDDARRSSVLDLIARIDRTTIQGVFRVLESVGAEKGEYVLLLQDNKHFCTCALLKNKGIVCRHFFWLMREDGRFVYNIQHIPRRWFRAERQDDPALLSDLNKVRLLTS